MKDNNKFTFANLFNLNRNGKGVEKEDEGPKNLKNFFKYFGRKWNKLLSVNLLMIFLVLPIIVAVFIYFMGPTTKAPVNVLYPTVYSAAFISNSPAADLMLSVMSFQMNPPAYNSYVFYIIGAIAILYWLTFGWQNIGGTYLLRGLVRGEPVFVISDYFYAIRKNFRQGFFIGLIDGLIIFLLFYDFLFFYYKVSSYMMDVMYVVTIALIIIYTIMRFYIYLQAVTFDLKIWKIFKNSFIFTVLGIKRNIMALLGIFAMAALNFCLIMLLIPLNIIVPLILPLFYFMAFSGFITVYAAYPVIEKYMIESGPAEENGKGGEDGDSNGDGDSESVI